MRFREQPLALRLYLLAYLPPVVPLLLAVALQPPPADLIGRLCALLIFAGLYFLVNSAGLALALGLQRGLRPFAIWSENLLWTAPGFVASALIAWGAAVAWGAMGAWAIIFLGPLGV